MRDIYTSATVEAAAARLAQSADDSEHTYPAMTRSWRQARDEFTPLGELTGAPDLGPCGLSALPPVGDCQI